MYNDSYNPELDPSKNPDLTGENTNEIAPGWEEVAAEADSENAPPPLGSPESYRSPEHIRRGTIGEDLDALRGYIDNNGGEDADSLEQLSESTDDVSPEESSADTSANKSAEKLDEAEVEARLREYIMSLESEFNSVRGMSNEGLRHKIRDEKYSLEQQLSGPEASTNDALRIDLAVRKRAEAIFRNLDLDRQNS